MYQKATAILLAFVLLSCNMPLSLAEAASSGPIASLFTSTSASIDTVNAPTGTSIFAGDRIQAKHSPALIRFFNGSAVQMTGADASFNLQGDALLIHAESGLLSFNIKEYETTITAGPFKIFSQLPGKTHAGILGLNNRRIVMSVDEGLFACVDTRTNYMFNVSPEAPLLLQSYGRGDIQKGGNTLADPGKSWKIDELKGSYINIRDEYHEILSNSQTMIEIKGTWRLETGSYDYMLIPAEAAVGGVRKSSSAKSWIALGIIGGAAGAGVLVYKLREGTKSPSSR